MQITTANLTNYERRNEFTLTNQFIGTSIRYTSAKIPGRQVTMVTKFCMLVPHVSESPVWDVPRHPSDAQNSEAATRFFENMYIPHTLTTPTYSVYSCSLLIWKLYKCNTSSQSPGQQHIR